MIIEDLIRLGRPMLHSSVSPAESLRLVSDITTASARNFLARVFIIEIDRGGVKTCVKAMPAQQWGEYIIPEGRKKPVFHPDIGRAVGAPFVIPKGGNPLLPQGCYGVPAYPIYDRQVKDIVTSREAAENYVTRRVNATVGMALSDAEIRDAVTQLHRTAKAMQVGKKEKLLGLVILAVIEEDGLYTVVDGIPVGDQNLAYMGPSVIHKGKYLAARLDKVRERFWQAKLVEGAEMGHRESGNSSCSFCANVGPVVSAYCKAWPWFTVTWSCPLPAALKKDEMVEGIALCAECYAALTLGANLFHKLTKRLDNWLTKELFSPVSTSEGKEMARRATPQSIFGCAYVLPLLDDASMDADNQHEYLDAMASMLAASPRTGRMDTHLQAITGFEMILPEETDADDYRMTIIYYSGDSSRGDIHLRATVGDVLPSTAKKLTTISKQIGAYAEETGQALHGNISDKYRVFLRRRHGSLPYLLTSAYGAPYIWSTLKTVLHCGRVSRKRFLRNMAARMKEIAKRLPDGLQELRGEVIFYLAFNKFLRQYRADIINKNGGSGLMTDWRELQSRIITKPVRELVLRDPEELGFATGHFVRLFAAQYWHASNNKDFLKHRVMTFGSSLTPDAIWKNALSRVDEYARKLNMKISDDLRQRVGVLLMEFSRLKNEIPREKDAFMAAFWAGYALAPTAKHDRA